MKKPFPLSFLLLSLLFFGPSRAAACSCISPPPPLEALQDSELVFSGKVLAVDAPRFPTSTLDPVEVTFSVGAVWKGRIPEQITVSTALSSASCGYEFTEGENYLVYTSRNVTEDSSTDLPQVSLCSRTQLLALAGEDLGVLPTPQSPLPAPVLEAESKQQFVWWGLGAVVIVGAWIFFARRR